MFKIKYKLKTQETIQSSIKPGDWITFSTTEYRWLVIEVKEDTFLVQTQFGETDVPFNHTFRGAKIEKISNHKE